MKTRHLFSMILISGLMIVLTPCFPWAGDSTVLFSMFKTHKSAVGELLRSAAFDGDLKGIRELLARGASVNERDKEGSTALMWAQLGNRPDAVRLLIERGADIDARDNNGHTALHQAAMAGREQVMQVLLAYGANVETEASSGYTPLIDAAYYGHAMAVELLLARGADPNTLTKQGHTAVSLATRNRHRNVAMLLVANGADPELQANRFRAALAKLESRSAGPGRVKMAGYLRNSDVVDTLCNDCRSQWPDPQLTFVSFPKSPVSNMLVSLCQKSGLGYYDETAPYSHGASEGVQRGRSYSQRAQTSGSGNMDHRLREAIETWEQIQSKYPDARKRLRDLSNKGASLESLAGKEPLLMKAISMWKGLQSEHPELAQQLLNLAGIGR